jgi:hypothetical protein
MRSLSQPGRSRDARDRDEPESSYPGVCYASGHPGVECCATHRHHRFLRAGSLAAVPQTWMETDRLGRELTGSPSPACQLTAYCNGHWRGAPANSALRLSARWRVGVSRLAISQAKVAVEVERRVVVAAVLVIASS